MEEYNIGDIFDFKGVTLMVCLEQENSCCDGCYMDGTGDCAIRCLPRERSDELGVIFKEITPKKDVKELPINNLIDIYKKIELSISKPYGDRIKALYLLEDFIKNNINE